MTILKPNTSLVELVTPELKLEIMSRVLTVSKPFFHPYHFSNKTNNKKAGMAINKILP